MVLGDVRPGGLVGGVARAPILLLGCGVDLWCRPGGLGCVSLEVGRVRRRLRIGEAAG